MGNSVQSNANPTFWKNIVLHGQEYDPRYGDVSFYHQAADPKQLYMHKSIWTDSSEDMQTIRNTIQNRAGITHPNIAEVVNYDKARDDQFMTSYFKDGIAWQYYDNNLDREIRSRTGNENYAGVRTYSEPQIWYFINSIVNADMTLKNQGGFYHGDIRPSTVLLDPDRKVKLIDNRLANPLQTLYDRMLFDKRVKGALSPNLLSQLAKKQVKPRYNPSREDSWGLGITALCAMKGKTLDDYYDWKVPEVRLYAIEEDLNILQGTYSPQLINFLRSCLREEEYQRYPIESHEEFLRSFQIFIDRYELDFLKKIHNTRMETIVKQTEDKKIVKNTNTLINQVIRADGEYFNDGLGQTSDINFDGDAVIPPSGEFFKTPEIIEKGVNENIKTVNLF